MPLSICWHALPEERGREGVVGETMITGHASVVGTKTTRLSIV